MHQQERNMMYTFHKEVNIILSSEMGKANSNATMLIDFIHLP